VNKRILELALKAGSTHKQNLGVYQFYEDELEKFAEFIVNECLRQAKEVVIPITADAIESKIKEYFRVE
jgi:hypothetical protein